MYAYEEMMMGGGTNEIPAAIARGVTKALLNKHPEIAGFVVHTSTVSPNELFTFESATPEEGHLLCLGATVLSRNDLIKFLGGGGGKMKGRGAPRKEKGKVGREEEEEEALEQGKVRPLVWSSKYDPDNTTQMGSPLLVIYAAIKHYWDKKQTRDTLTGNHRGCFKSYCNWFSYSYQLSLFFSDL